MAPLLVNIDLLPMRFREPQLAAGRAAACGLKEHPQVGKGHLLWQCLGRFDPSRLSAIAGQAVWRG